MKGLNLIGLNTKKTAELSEKLNNLLANFQVYYQNLRGVHWNIKGPHFFELHVKFEELYTEAHTNVDDIAERILTLGHSPLHTYKDYIKIAEVKVGKDITGDVKAVELILGNLQTLLQLERATIEVAAEMGDEGTVSLISDLITSQEKMVWMFSAWLNKA
ncbi:Dps family protein [Sediminitomix flava]|uniref:Starvation-inducible DNA-binding protein n=1 Tax=Sediminitomix flava TaxID=379075 RepID=A0A315Z817_SEDFL|nr:DNA starvation/stationary phase protection protein [Sediminitomix flava]PWJ40808.1 starvation-inducible DNA-binding protein [Sediminitomix flava]